MDVQEGLVRPFFFKSGSMPSIIHMFDILMRGGIMSNIIHTSDIIQGMVLLLGVFLGDLQGKYGVGY